MSKLMERNGAGWASNSGLSERQLNAKRPIDICGVHNRDLQEILIGGIDCNYVLLGQRRRCVK